MEVRTAQEEQAVGFCQKIFNFIFNNIALQALKHVTLGPKSLHVNIRRGTRTESSCSKSKDEQTSINGSGMQDVTGVDSGSEMIELERVKDINKERFQTEKEEDDDKEKNGKKEEDDRKTGGRTNEKDKTEKIEIWVPKKGTTTEQDVKKEAEERDHLLPNSIQTKPKKSVTLIMEEARDTGKEKEKDHTLVSEPETTQEKKKRYKPRGPIRIPSNIDDKSTTFIEGWKLALREKVSKLPRIHEDLK